MNFLDTNGAEANGELFNPVDNVNPMNWLPGCVENTHIYLHKGSTVAMFLLSTRVFQLVLNGQYHVSVFNYSYLSGTHGDHTQSIMARDAVLYKANHKHPYTTDVKV